MRCIICSESNWENMDHLKAKKVGMCMCKKCGFMSFPTHYKTEEELKEYYRKSYRPPPQTANLFAGERKLQYHEFFLGPLFEEWKRAGLEKPVIGEIGSAHGMFLNWVRTKIPDAYIHGTELTTSYRRVAFHEYGLKLEEDFDTSIKYDLICSYHVLEHQLDADKRLAEYAACLKDSGIFYLSMPIWFREATNSGGGGFDIDAYWIPDHVNGWSEEHLEHIIARAGLEILMKDTAVYGNTYILKKTTKPAPELVTNFKKHKEIAEKIYAGWQHLQGNKTALAIEAWPNNPSAWINHYELNRAEFHKSRKETDKFLKDAVDSCPNSGDTLIYAGDILTRYERYEESLETLKKALTKKPNSPTVIMGMANCHRMMAKKSSDLGVKKKHFETSINMLRFVMSISADMMPQALTWCYHDQSELPTALESTV